MKRNANYVEAEGMVHLVHPIMGGDYTLCGDAYDLASDEPGYAWRGTLSRRVSCPKCAAVVMACRGVSIASPTNTGEGDHP